LRRHRTPELAPAILVRSGAAPVEGDFLRVSRSFPAFTKLQFASRTTSKRLSAFSPSAFQSLSGASLSNQDGDALARLSSDENNGTGSGFEMCARASLYAVKQPINTVSLKTA
jgi:hypothetical protein